MARRSDRRNWRVVKQISDGPVHHNSYHHTRDEANKRRDTIKAQGMLATVVKRDDKFPKTIKPPQGTSKPHKLETPPSEKMTKEEAAAILNL